MVSFMLRLHRLSSRGIVDRDARDDAEVSYLKSLDVYVLNLSELENLLLTEDVLRFVAEKLHRDDFTYLLEKAKTVVLGEMEKGKDRLLSSVTAAVIERRLTSFDAKAVGATELESSLHKLVAGIDVSSIYQSTCDKVDEILNDKNYDEAIKIYSNKGLIYQISSIFGFKSNELVEFIRRLLSNKEGEPLIKIMQQQIPQIEA